MMFCILHKWSISQSMDLTKPLARRVVRHMRRCPECRSFRERSQIMTDRLIEAGDLLSPQVSTELHAKIMCGVLRQNHKNGGTVAAGMNIHRVWLRLSPALAAAIILLGVVGLHIYVSSQQKADGVIRSFNALATVLREWPSSFATSR